MGLVLPCAPPPRCVPSPPHCVSLSSFVSQASCLSLLCFPLSLGLSPIDVGFMISFYDPSLSLCVSLTLRAAWCVAGMEEQTECDSF